MPQTRKPRIAVLDFLDLPSHPDTGHLFSASVSELLHARSQHLVIEKNWAEILKLRNGIPPALRFHQAWAVDAGSVIGVDAVVIGKLQHSWLGGNASQASATLLETNSGESLAQIRSFGVERLTKTLNSRRLAAKIPIRRRTTYAEICAIFAQQAILNVGRESGLCPGDRLRIERILGQVPDPIVPATWAPLNAFSTMIGEAKVLEVGQFTTLACCQGRPRPQPGDICVLTKA